LNRFFLARPLSSENNFQLHNDYDGRLMEEIPIEMAIFLNLETFLGKTIKFLGMRNAVYQVISSSRATIGDFTNLVLYGFILAYSIVTLYNTDKHTLFQSRCSLLIDLYAILSCQQRR
jgi:hypothetical protein